MEWKALAANLVWFLYSAMRTRIWKHARQDVALTQAGVLDRTLAKNADTEFGRAYGFRSINSVSSFQRAVPISDYEDFEPAIERIARGTPNVLTADPVLRFGLSSGSTRASKLVPYTQSLIADFQEGIDPWVYYLLKQFPTIMSGKAYWSVTPVGSKEKYSAAGIPIGFDDERAYFSWLTQWVLGNVMVTPSPLALVEDIEVFRYTTLRLLLQEKFLSWLSIWNPSFVLLLLDPLQQWFDQLVEDVRTGTLSVNLGVAPEIDRLIRQPLKKLPNRAQEIATIRKKWHGIPFTTQNGSKQTFFEAIWPRLHLISCWAHGNAQAAVTQLKTCFPNVTVQPKGLIATEAFVSFPIYGEASALSITSHFFEFEELENDEIRLAHELQRGKRYSVIITTSGGFYRYRLHDIIEVIGFEATCPLIRFVGKEDKIVDIFGEKLNELFASDVISPLNLDTNFLIIAPEKSDALRATYTLFIQPRNGSVASDHEWRSLGQKIDQALRNNYHYDYCRRLGQLDQCRIFLIEPDFDAPGTYLRVCAQLGQRLGDIKPGLLHPFGQWSSKFQGRFIS